MYICKKRKEESLVLKPLAHSSTPDCSTPDSSTPDSSTPDCSTPDSSTPDSSTPDCSTPDSSTPNSSTPDSSTPDCRISQNIESHRFSQNFVEACSKFYLFVGFSILDFNLSP